MMENKNSLTFSFCGDYEVNARAVSTAISSLVDLSTAIAEKAYPDVEFRLSVRAIRPGSLEFDFTAAAIVLQPLLSSETISYAANMITVMAAAFKIKKFLKGTSPKSKSENDGTLIITRNDGSKLEIPSKAGVYFIDNRIDKSITNIIESVRVYDGVTGISIESDDRVEIKKEDFDACSKEIPLDIDDETDTFVTVRRNEVLFIRQADLTGELKWRFTGAENITAKILDDRFVSRVKTGQQSIKAGMYIVADVRVTMKLGPDNLPDENKRLYEVVRVHSINVPGEGQLKLDV